MIELVPATSDWVKNLSIVKFEDVIVHGKKGPYDKYIICPSGASYEAYTSGSYITERQLQDHLERDTFEGITEDECRQRGHIGTEPIFSH